MKIVFTNTLVARDVGERNVVDFCCLSCCKNTPVNPVNPVFVVYGIYGVYGRCNYAIWRLVL